MLAVPASAQGGFNRTAVSFGDGDRLSSDMVIADVNFDDEMDAIVACSDGENDHVIYWSIASEEPDEPTEFATSRGHSLLVLDTFGDGAGRDIIVVDEEGIRLYLNDGTGGYDLEDYYDITGHGAPVFAQSGYFASATVKGLVVGYADRLICFPLIYELIQDSPYYVIDYEEVGAVITSMHIMDIVPGDLLELLVLTDDGTLYVYAMGEEEADLYGWAPFEGALYIAPGNEAGTLLAVATATELLIYEWQGDPGEEFVLVNEGDLPFARHVMQIVAAELTGDSTCDFVVRAAGMTYILKQLQEGYELYELIGFPDGVQHAKIRVADVNDDDHVDIVVADIESSHRGYINDDRLEVSIYDADDAYQVSDGDAFAVFTIELDAAPVSPVWVTVETGEEDEIEEEGGGDEDGLPNFPDVSSFLNGQAAPPLRHVPTVQTLIFGIGISVQQFYVPLTFTFVGQSVVLPASLSNPIGVVISTIAPSAHGPVHPAPTLSRDWRIDGSVNAIAAAGGNIHLGGEFGGFTWDINDGISNIDLTGRRRFVQPAAGLSAPDAVHCMATDTWGRLYIGGSFSFSYNSQTFENIARLNLAGEWDPTWNPRPDGPVYAIAVDFPPNSLPGTEVIYFGGKFIKLQGADVDVRNLACIPANATVTPGAGWTDRVRRIMVTHKEPDGTISEFVPESGEVRALAISNSANLQNAESYLAIGGSNLNSVRIWDPTITDGTELGGGNKRRMRNLAFVRIRILGSSRPLYVSPTPFPRVTLTGGDAVVNNVAISTTLMFDDSEPTMEFDPHYASPAHFAVVFTGEFDEVTYRFEEKKPSEPYVTTTLDSVNIGITTVASHMPSKTLGHLPTDTVPILSMAMDQGDRIWIARDTTATPLNENTIWIYRILTDTSNQNARLEQDTGFNLGPNGVIHDLVFRPVGAAGEMIAAGSFTSRPAVHTPLAGPNIDFDLPARNITAYNTSTGPVGSGAGYGAHRLTFRPGVLDTNTPIACVAFNQGVLGGLHFYGSDLTETTLERSNLAAVTTDDTILDWGPHAEGPIHALATDTSPPTPQVYFGGEGNILLLPSAPGAGQAVVGSAPGDGVAIIPNEWFTVATGAPGTRVVRALGVCPDALVIGGRFDKIEDLVTSNARTGAGAVPLFDPLTATGGQKALAWAPSLGGNGIVNAIIAGPVNTQIAGDFSTTGTVIHAFGSYNSPSGTTPATLQTGYDPGFASGDVVNGMRVNFSVDFCFAGDLTVNGQSRVAAVWNGSPGGNSAITSSYQAQSGTGTSVGLTSTGYGFVVGGDFHEIWNGTAWVERRGLFACSTTGLNSWQYNILDPQVTGEAVRAVSWWGASWNWVGGNFSLSDPDNFRRIDAP